MPARQPPTAIRQAHCAGLGARVLWRCFVVLAAMTAALCLLLWWVSRGGSADAAPGTSLENLSWRELAACWLLTLLPIWAIARLASRVVIRHIEAPVASLIEQCKKIVAGAAPRMLASAADSKELLPLVTALNELLSNLNRSIARQHRFVADAAHELRTPLTAQTVVGQNALARRETKAELCEAVSSMLEEANHMKRLIDSLLALTRASLTQAEMEKVHRTPLDLSELARRCVQSLHVLAEEKQQIICVECVGPLWAAVDLTMVRQALLNIIHNAIEHCPENSEIRIATAAQAEEALIVVSDNGPGIAVEDQPRVFERFYRGSIVSRRRGLGLGLAIARALLAAQGGRIKLHSAPGSGCRFELALPLAAPSCAGPASQPLPARRAALRSEEHEHRIDLAPDDRALDPTVHHCRKFQGQLQR